MKRHAAPNPEMTSRTPVPRLAFRIDEAAESAGLSRSKLYEEMALGNLHFVKCGSRRLIPVAELEAFLSRLAGFA